MSKAHPELSVLLAKLTSQPDNRRLQFQCVDAFVQILRTDPDYFFRLRPEVLEILGSVFDKDEINHQNLEPLATGQIKLKYGWQGEYCDAVAEATVVSLAKDSLFLAVLEKTYVTDAFVESLLVATRKFLLYRFLQDGELQDGLWLLAIGLAQQAFNNEYIWNTAEDELGELPPLVRQVSDPHPQTGRNDHHLAQVLAVLGMYQPLSQLSLVPGTQLEQLAAACPGLSKAIERMVLEPRQEREIALSIPCLKPFQNQVSLEVQSHYEENPFPRWFSPGGPHRSLDERLRGIKPDFQPVLPLPGKKRSVLIAGCGTGQHPISVAAGSPDVEVLAMDLSLTSLAYAKRMSLKHGIGNISFMQGDLQDIELLEAGFDHIECVGVLHCLEQPMRGWRALDRVLVPGGTFRVAVYSKLARIHIEAARKVIRKEGIRPTPSEMKAFRARLMQSQGFELLRHHLMRRDFFNLSMFRDLIFHAHEYCYELGELLEIINELGLNFLGFYADDSLRQRYVDMFPDDPWCNNSEYWKKFEVHYTGSGQMFSCWLQKPV